MDSFASYLTKNGLTLLYNLRWLKAPIFHQWDQLEAMDRGRGKGWVFADSDAYKWLDAASRIYALHPIPELASCMDWLIVLLAHAPMEDDYLFPYNPIHFPGQRWANGGESQTGF